MLSLTILGNNSAIPAHNRHPTAQVLQIQDEHILIDCGEGTQMQMARYKVKSSKINRIFISHLHGDHYYGLAGLLTSMSLLNRTNDLHIHGPAPLGEIINMQFKLAEVNLSYSLHFHPVAGEGIAYEDEKIQVQCFALQHRIECWGYLFKEKKNLRKINIEQVKKHQVPPAFFDALHKGQDYILPDGAVISNQLLTTAAPLPKSYAYCSDTIFDEGIAEKIKGATALYHEATYLHDEAKKAAERYHSTALQAAIIAQKAGVQQLLLGHFSSRYEDLDAFLTEACPMFENTGLALEGVCFKI
ncbi:MAG TPA: ribonuclease Z [Ferruginibacter sp.]|nr:ribonuclease Z [Ferruginibacter sp.]HMP22033.1 ribonuclease Z [Ferruginibacter sp.]